MKGSAQAALALGVGYMLGRRRKMRLATMLAVGAATGGLGKFGPVALKRGAKLLNSTDIAGALGPQVNDIVSTIRGELLDAGKAAAAAAVSSQIDALSDNLHQRAETLRNPEAAVSGARDTVGRAGEETVGRVGGSVGRRRRRGRPADTEEDVPEDREDLPEDREERRNGRSRRERPPARRRARSEADDDAREPEDEYEEYEDEEPEEDFEDDELEESPADLDEPPADDEEDVDEEPAPRRRRRSSRSPVTRTGR